MKRIHVFLILAALCFIAYGNTLNNKLVGFDDAILLENNPGVFSRYALYRQSNLVKYIHSNLISPRIILPVLLGRNVRLFHLCLNMARHWNFTIR